MRWLLISIFIAGEFYHAKAQNLDSLRSLIHSHSTPDTSRILALAELSYELRRSNTDSSFLLAKQALDLSQKIKFPKGKGRALRLIGIIHYLKSDYLIALENYKEALAISLKANDVKNIANCYNNIGTIYHSQSEYAEAEETFQKSLAIRLKINDKRGIAQVYGNLASIYLDQSRVEEALSGYKKSLEVYLKLDDNEGIASSYRNIGTVYRYLGNSAEALKYFQLSLDKRKEKDPDKYGIAFLYNDLGSVYKERGDYQRALEYFFEALKIQEEVGTKQGMAASFNNIGNIYKDQGNYDKALEYFLKSLKIKEEIGSRTGIANSYSEIGSLHLERKEIEKARQSFLKSLAIREEIGDRSGVALNCSELAGIFIKDGNFSKALSFLDRGMQISHEVKSDPVVCNLYLGYALYYNSIGNPRKAQGYALKAKDLAVRMDNIEYLRSAAEQKSLAAEKLGYYKEALEDRKLFQVLDDSIQDLNSIKKALALEYTFKEEKTKIEGEKKELELRAINDQQTRIAYTLMGIALALIIILLLIYRSSQQRRKANEVLRQRKREIERTNAQLEESDSIKNRLLSIISHDVRSPLNSLNGLLFLFNNNALSQDELKMATASVSTQVMHLNDFLDNLLRWTKNQMSQVEPQKKNLSLAILVKSIVDLMELTAKNKGLSIEVNFSSELMINADEEMMKCVLRNLLANSIKFCAEADNIRIYAQQEITHVKISVEDTGRGIHPEDLPQLFGSNHLSTKGTRDEVGTGLGLVLCKELVAKNGGEISVTSKLNEGSCFTFTVPVAVS